jgi:predicted HTH domain antitoxin
MGTKQDSGASQTQRFKYLITEPRKTWVTRRFEREHNNSLWQAATTCDMSLWEMIEEAKKREIHVPYTIEEFRKNLKGI